MRLSKGLGNSEREDRTKSVSVTSHSIEEMTTRRCATRLETCQEVSPPPQEQPETSLVDKDGLQLSRGCGEQSVESRRTDSLTSGDESISLPMAEKTPEPKHEKPDKKDSPKTEEEQGTHTNNINAA